MKIEVHRRVTNAAHNELGLVQITGIDAKTQTPITLASYPGANGPLRRDWNYKYSVVDAGHYMTPRRLSSAVLSEHDAMRLHRDPVELLLNPSLCVRAVLGIRSHSTPDCANDVPDEIAVTVDLLPGIFYTTSQNPGRVAEAVETLKGIREGVNSALLQEWIDVSAQGKLLRHRPYAIKVDGDPGAMMQDLMRVCGQASDTADLRTAMRRTHGIVLQVNDYRRDLALRFPRQTPPEAMATIVRERARA